MSIVNRRNAIIGWLTLKAAKIVARDQSRKLTRKVPLRRKRRGKR